MANLHIYRSYKPPVSDADTGQTTYHAMIRWVLKEKKLELIQDTADQKLTKVTTLTWEKSKLLLSPTLDDYGVHKVIHDFVTRCGVPMGTSNGGVARNII